MAQRKRTSKSQPITIEAVYPNGMTREQYRAELRKRARYFALLFLKIYPDVLSTNNEERKAA